MSDTVSNKEEITIYLILNEKEIESKSHGVVAYTGNRCYNYFNVHL